ncbi:M48 family metallopeptidase [Methylomarinum sp. Ch1-1]|uniref:M48 family metallopeptidase n=1 Tax=Methylomarinum roseum TaxID=3067653 RepID=A0AAU7NZ04_9GAMM|nr:M48 family metallopeptidase [Methylomarinum sp. Ch1-1]MDP4521617.1 M48 family metallopeptidase [Methylomarinum sp. Ch1-1]
MLHKFLLSLACALTLSACATSPTGRSQFIYMPDTQINQMGLQAFDNLKSEKALSNNSRYIQFADCVAEALVHEVGGDWEVVVFQDDSLNAFALPGNKIGVHSGLIDLVDNQDQLAAVIGHEIGHVMARHSNERMSQETAVNTGIALIQAVSAPETALGQSAIGLLGIGAQYGIILPYSRTHESEADIIGLELMAKAGFDPRHSITLWQKMDAAGNGQAPAEFLSTHPSHDTRIEDLNKHMPKALKDYQQALSIGKQPRCSK